jgi:hypothetical protein
LSLLDDLKTDIDAALTGALRAATYWRATSVSDGIGGFTTTWTSHTCEGLRSAYDAVVAAQADIPRTDAKIELLASSLSVTVAREDKIKIDDQWWIIREIALDPSGAWWTLQCSSTEAAE